MSGPRKILKPRSKRPAQLPRLLGRARLLVDHRGIHALPLRTGDENDEMVRREIEQVLCANPPPGSLFSHNQLEGLSGLEHIIEVDVEASRADRFRIIVTSIQPLLSQLRGDGGVASLPVDWQARFVAERDKARPSADLQRFMDDRIGDLRDFELPQTFDGFSQARRAFSAEIQTRLEQRLVRAVELLGTASADERRKFTTALRDELASIDLQLKCPKCGKPAILRFGRAGNMLNAFSFDHTESPRTRHASSVDPPEQLVLINKRPDRRRKG